MKYFLYLSFCLLSSHTWGQPETNYWFFGFNGGLNFSSGTPVPESGSPIYQIEGSSSISDPVTGNLLFYTDGRTVYDASHAVMPNGTGLMGHSSTTQSALIVPQPGSTSLFYVFTNDRMENNGALGFRYSVVDITLNGGMGDVTTTKNVLLHTPTSEQVSAVKHANCEAWWIMSKEMNNNVYHAYLLTSSGISDTVTSVIGLNTGPRSYGQGKFSPDGTMYAISTGNNSTYVGISQLFDFDNTTGLLSNPLTLVDLSMGEDTYSLSFSGDNSKLYLLRGAAAPGIPAGSDLYQYDLSSGSHTAILASATYIGYCVAYNQMQLGRDHKLYLAHTGTYSDISVVNYPNIAGTGCGLNIGAIPISGSGKTGICNFPDSYFNENGPCITEPVPQPQPEPEPIEQLVISIPNIITPNGDGINDVFSIQNLPPSSSLHIFNRWGNLIFMTDDYQNDWKTGNDGVYFYILKIPDGKIYPGCIQVNGN